MHSTWTKGAQDASEDREGVDAGDPGSDGSQNPGLIQEAVDAAKSAAEAHPKYLYL